VPPPQITALKPILPAEIWLQGIHSRLLGISPVGSSVRSPSWPAITPAIIAWVWGTPLGMPVEPEVNRYLATVAGIRLSRLAATSLGSVAATVSKATAPSPAPSAVTSSRSGRIARSVAMALSNKTPDWANTTLGATFSKQCLSLPWSVDIRL
jgi:hypothetical protein